MLTRDDMESDRALRLQKVIVRTTAVIGMISLLYTAYLYYDYRARMPTEPQLNAGGHIRLISKATRSIRRRRSNAVITPRSTSSSRV